MALNEDQSGFLESVRAGELSPKDVVASMARAPNVGYRSVSFPELLFGLDGTHRLSGSGWYEVFVKKLIKHSTFFDDGRICPEEQATMGTWFESYGVGEYGIELIVEMTHHATSTPPNWSDFMRTSIKSLYAGIHPISEHGLFVLNRWIDLATDRAELSENDAELISHINRHTKGLDNTPRFARLYAGRIGEYVTRTNATPGFDNGQEWLAEEFALCPELGPNESLLLEYLEHHGVTLTNRLSGLKPPARVARLA